MAQPNWNWWCFQEINAFIRNLQFWPEENWGRGEARPHISVAEIVYPGKLRLSTWHNLESYGKELPKSGWSVGLSVEVVLIVNSCRKTQTTMGSTIPWAGVLDCLKRQEWAEPQQSPLSVSWLDAVIKLLLLWPSHHHRLWHWTVSQNRPFPLDYC